MVAPEHCVLGTGTRGRGVGAQVLAGRVVRRSAAAPQSAPRGTARGRYGRAAIICLALAAILTLAPSQALPDTLDVLVIGAAAADLGTTEWALSRPGLREVNPLLQGPPQRMVGKALATAAVIGGTALLERRGHRGWSRGLRIAAMVAWSGMAVNNAIQARRSR